MTVSWSVGADTLWTIGKNDGNHAEFAISGSFSDFAKTFPEDVVFKIGSSKAGKNWPFIHPGPADAWAGAKSHSFKIQFTLGKIPKSACRLMLHINDTQSGSPPTLSVNVNDHACAPVAFGRGAGDDSLSNPKAGRHAVQPFVFPGNWLRRGTNMVTLTVTDGSWLLYDALSLESGLPNSPSIERITAECTPMFRTVDGVLKQAVRVEVVNAGLDGKVDVHIADCPGSEQTVNLGSGLQVLWALAPPFTQTENRAVVLTVGDKAHEARFEARPERQWKLFAAASAHTDIGYTDLQEKCMALHVDNASKGIEASVTDPNFKWNLEVFAQADWIKELKPEMVPALEQGIRDKKIGLTGLYLNMLTGLCSGEEMMWLLRPAQKYSRSLGVPVEMASLNDVPSTVGTLPMFLRQAGIRYFSDAINEDRGPVFMHADPEMNQSPFWWEAPDGSRILAIFTRTYFQVYQVNMHVSLDAMEQTLPRFMAKFVRPDYPGDAIFLNGAFLDNCAMTPHYAEVAKEWNAKWDFPKIIIATPDEYFRYVETEFGNKLPVYRGDMGVFWEDGAASSALETGMVRWAKAQVATSEKWQALATASKPCEMGLDGGTGVWKDILYYDEHTWGSAVSISDPNNPQSTGQWARKAAFADRALKQGHEWAQKGDAALCQLAKTGLSHGGHTLLVSNPMSWTRDIVVTVPSKAKGNSVRDKASGKHVPAQDSGAAVTFVASNVPAMGYRMYTVGSGSPAQEKPLLQSVGANAWRTDKVQFEISPQNGALVSIRDIATGKEWVDASSGFGLNQFLYVSGGNGTAMIHPGAKRATDLTIGTHEKAEVREVENGPARAVIEIKRTGGAFPVDTQLVIHRDGTMDFINVLHKPETVEKEAGYFVFPFGLNTPDSARAFLELPYGIVEVDQEQMPGACREWYSVNTFAAAGNASGSAYVAAPDTPLFCVGDINRGLWPNRLNGNRNVLYAYVFNNYWHTNYKASQGGDIRCAFSVRLSDKPFDPVTATRFGWARALDMTPDRTGAVPVNGAGAGERSFVTLDEGPVVLGELHSMADGVLARLYNPTCQPAKTSLAIRGLKPKATLATDLFGENGKPIPCGEKITVPARGIANILMKAK